MIFASGVPIAENQIIFHVNFEMTFYLFNQFLEEKLFFPCHKNRKEAIMKQ